jgi:hypothetical protein
VNFYFFFRANALFYEEFENVASVIALKLDDCTPLFIFYSGAIAAPCLLKGPNHFLEV